MLKYKNIASVKRIAASELRKSSNPALADEVSSIFTTNASKSSNVLIVSDKPDVPHGAPISGGLGGDLTSIRQIKSPDCHAILRFNRIIFYFFTDGGNGYPNRRIPRKIRYLGGIPSR